MLKAGLLARAAARPVRAASTKSPGHPPRPVRAASSFKLARARIHPMMALSVADGAGGAMRTEDTPELPRSVTDSATRQSRMS